MAEHKRRLTARLVRDREGIHQGGWVGGCDCGWEGPIRYDLDQAADDADEHERAVSDGR